MTEQTHARGNTPWVVAAVAALVVAALALLLVHVLSVRDDNKHNVGSRMGPTEAQQTAVQAGATEATNILTFSRKTYETDFARALKGTTGALNKDLTSRKKTTLASMTKGKFDLRAKVVEAAFESEQSGKVVMLVTVNGNDVNDAGQASAATPQRLELTMVQVGGRWLASNLISVQLQ